MYKFLLILLSVVGMATATSAQQKQDMNSRQSNHKILVAYFSATGTTARAAQKVAHATGGELYAITPAQPYTDADLNWNDKQSRRSVEMNDPKARPAIKSQKRQRYCQQRGGVAESLSRFELAGGQVAQPYRRADRPAVGGGVGILTARTNKGYPYGFRPVDGGSFSRGNGRSAGLFGLQGVPESHCPPARLVATGGFPKNRIARWAEDTTGEDAFTEWLDP